MLAHGDSPTFRVTRTDTLLGALDLLANKDFDIAIVDLSLPDSQGLETFLTIQRHAPNLPVIVVTGTDDESVAIKAVRQGAQDYIVKGELKREKLIRSVNYALARSQQPAIAEAPQKGKAQMLGVLGSKGGVGTTTIACHWAMELSRQTDESVLLTDLDISSAISSFLLRLEGKYTLLDTALNLHRLDTDLWRAMICPAPQHKVDFLPPAGAVRLADELNPERIRHVLRFAQRQYSWIIVDLGRLTTASFMVIEELNDLLIVTTADLLALHETTRLIRRLLEAGVPQQRLKLVLNQHGRGTPLSPADVEKALAYPVYAALGDCSDELQQSYSKGRFLDEKSKMRKEVSKALLRWRGAEEALACGPALSFFRRHRN